MSTHPGTRVVSMASSTRRFIQAGTLAFQGLFLAMAVLFTGCQAGHIHTHGDERASQGKPLQPFVRPLPDVQEYVRLLEYGETVTMHSGLVTLQPGENCGWHSTEGFEELLICLAGEGHIESGDTGRRSLAAGHYAYNPPHTRHNVFNTSAQPMRYIYVVAAVPAETETAKDSGQP